MKHSTVWMVACMGAAAPSFAQAPPDGDGWSGEGAFSAGFTTGNTETRDLGLGLKLKHAGRQWIQSGEFAADYGDTNGVESRNRVSANGQIDYILDPQWSIYSRLSYERDEFSGFENRYFAGVGAAWKVLNSEATKWTLEGGPGYKIDDIRATAISPASTEESVGGRAGSRFTHAFNERVALSNNTEAVVAETSTQLSNVVALTANLMGNLNARVSVDVRHDTDPLPGFKATDTATKFSLIYKLE